MALNFSEVAVDFTEMALDLMESAARGKRIRMTQPNVGEVRELIAKTLYEFCGPEKETPPAVQVVFFHGTEHGDSSNAYLDTWKSADGSTLWPKWLAEKFRNPRILSVAYDSSLIQGLRMGRLDLYRTAENLIQDLSDPDAGVTTREGCPVVMVGKDLGCLVIEEVCVHAIRRKMSVFLSNLKGFVFYCPPLMGLEEVSGSWDGELAQALRRGNKEISRLNSEFFKLKQEQNWVVNVMIAANQTESRERIRHVPEVSARVFADDFYTAAEDIRSICKPHSIASKSFIFLRDVISDCLTRRRVHECDGLPLHSVKLMERACEVEKRLKETSGLGTTGTGQEGKNELRGATVLGIVGMGGVGKTTLAKQLFNNISCQFEYTCFVQDVKDWSPKHTLGDHLKSNFYRCGKRTSSLDWRNLEGKRTLIVIDDVDSREQLTLLPALDGMGEGSAVVITTRDQELLKYFRKCIRHEVTFLKQKDAKRLFCLHVFGRENFPESTSTELSTNAKIVIEKCGGLPLTLEVLGEYLRGHEDDATIWMETIDKLTEADSISGEEDDRVWSKLQVSYNALAKAEREMFIDAATFFADQPLEEAFAAWDTEYGKPETRWANLVSRCLVKCRTLSWDEEPFTVRGEKVEKVGIWMHEHLRALGKKLYSQKRVLTMVEEEPYPASLDELSLGEEGITLCEKVWIWMHEHLPALGKKLCSQKGVLAMVEEEPYPASLDELGRSYDTGIIRRHYRHSSRFDIPDMRSKDLKYLVIHGDSFPYSSTNFPSNLLLLRWRASYRLSSFDAISFSIELAKMKKLAVLQLGGLEQKQPLRFPNSLRILKLSNITDLPQNFGTLSYLRVLDLECPNLKELPESFGYLSSLLTLVLRRCGDLLSLPKSFGTLRSLQQLNIGSEKLQRLPESFGDLGTLEILEMKCPGMEKLPGNFGQLSALRTLKIDCDSLWSIPDSIGELSLLTELDIRTSNLQCLPDSIGRVSSLKKWTLQASSLACLPESIGELLSLQEWTLAASSLACLPKSIGKLSSLKTWILDASSLTCLPESIGNLSSPQFWTISASSLPCLPESKGQFSSRERWDFHASSLTCLPESIGKLSSLKRWDLDASSLTCLPESIGNLSSLKRWDLDASSLTCLPESIGNLSSLQIWCLRASSLTCLPESVGNLSSLKGWSLREASSLNCLPESIGKLSSLKTWDLDASSLTCLPESIGNLSCLQIWFLRASSLTCLPESIGNLSSLQRWFLTASSLTCLPESIENLSSLQQWSIIDHSLTALPESIKKPPSLKDFEMRRTNQKVTRHRRRQIC